MHSALHFLHKTLMSALSKPKIKFADILKPKFIPLE